MLGPCFQCAAWGHLAANAWGHLAANCPTKDKAVYPFCQPVVNKAEVSDNPVSDVVAIYNEHDVQTVPLPLSCEGDNNIRAADLGVRPLLELCADVLKRRVLTTNSNFPQDINYDPEAGNIPQSDRVFNQNKRL